MSACFMKAVSALEQRSESVQILRGVAAFSVMCLHFTYANANFNEKLPALSSLFQLGGLGVQAFFVISGYVIPRYMYVSEYTTQDWWRFLASRFIRLEPPYIASIFIALLLSWAAATAPGFRGPSLAFDATGLALHLLYLAPWFEKEWVIGVYWTLAIELQYYVLMLVLGPLLISGCKTRTGIFFLVVIAVVMVTRDGRALSPYLPFFSFGFVAFLIQAKFFSTLVSTALLVCTVFACNILWPAPATTVGLIAFGSIFIPVRQPIPALSFLGAISYSLYLLHAPIGGRVVNLFARSDSQVVVFAGFIIAIIVSIAAATLLWALVERSATYAARRWSHRKTAQSSTT